MSRSVDEWIGKTDDAMPPPRVRLRIFEAHKGICHLTGRKIEAGDAWDLDHVQALCNGGENRETNLAPALRDAHRAKTAADVKVRAKSDRVRKKHIGIHQTKAIIPGSKRSPWKRKLDGTLVRRNQE